MISEKIDWLLEGARRERIRWEKSIDEIIGYIDENPYPDDVFVSMKSKAIRNIWKNWNKGVSEKLKELKKEARKA